MSSGEPGSHTRGSGYVRGSSGSSGPRVSLVGPGVAWGCGQRFTKRSAGGARGAGASLLCANWGWLGCWHLRRPPIFLHPGGETQPAVERGSRGSRVPTGWRWGRGPHFLGMPLSWPHAPTGLSPAPPLLPACHCDLPAGRCVREVIGSVQSPRAWASCAHVTEWGRQGGSADPRCPARRSSHPLTRLPSCVPLPPQENVRKRAWPRPSRGLGKS